MTKKRGRPRKVTDGVVENIPLDELENTKKIDEVVNEVVNDLDTNNSNDFEGTQGNYNPLMENVVERDYSTPVVAQTEVADIEEPSFVPPSYEEIVANRQEQQIASEPSPFDNINPAFNELEDKDKKIATESLVDTCLDAYEQLHKYAEYVIKVDEEELMQKQMEGKIDLSSTVPISETESMTLGEFVQQYNEQGSSAIKYDKEFTFKVRPAMIRVFMKRGWGMSDEQFLIYMFGKDIAVKVGIMYSLKKTINSTLAMMEKIHKREQRGNPRPAPVTRETNPEPTPQPMGEEDIVTIPDEQVEEYLPDNEQFTTNMNINMPQNPTDPLKEHPQEIRSQLKNEKKGNK